MLEQIKKIREQTGAGMVDVKKALDEAKGDEQKAVNILRKKGQSKANKKAGREAKEGVIGNYLHFNNKLGAMVELHCETDFVARNEEFQELAKDIAMHISASNPQVVNASDISDSVIEKEKEIWMEQLKREKKPVEIIGKIIEGKEKKFREESALMTQPFIKNTDVTVGEFITEKIGKIGENIQIGKFTRFEI